MFRTTNTIKKAAASLALATAVAALVVPTALAGGSPSGRYLDGWYGYAVAQTQQQHPGLSDGRSPDTRDAATAAHADLGSQDGWYGYAVSITKQQQKQATLFDGRSPDTRDAASAASQSSVATLLDGRSPDTRDAATAASIEPFTSSDGRSPDTVDAAIQAHSPVVTVVRSPGFQWGDFGIGIAAAFGLMLLVLASMRVLATRNRQPGPVATA